MTNADERIKDMRIDADTLGVELMDGRTITVPLAWYPRLAGASPATPRTSKHCATINTSDDRSVSVLKTAIPGGMLASASTLRAHTTGRSKMLDRISCRQAASTTIAA